MCSHSDHAPEGLGPADCASLRNPATITFIAHGGLMQSPVLAHMLNSLVRVSRRGKGNHFAKDLVGQTAPTRRHPTQTNQAWHTLVTALRPASRGRSMTQLRHWFPSLPFQQFQVLFNSLFKVLCIFPSRYLCAIGLPPKFSLRWNLPPT